jgi:hypothetical protein
MQSIASFNRFDLKSTSIECVEQIFAFRRRTDGRERDVSSDVGGEGGVTRV